MMQSIRKLWRLAVAHPLAAAYSLAVLSTLALLALAWGASNSPDTFTYVEAMRDLAQGRLNWLRTPVYPAIMLACHAIAGEAFYLKLLILLQHACFLASIYFLYRSLTAVSASRTVNLVLMAAYALHPGITSWNALAIPESLATGAMVMLVYTLTRLWRRPCRGGVVWMLVWTLFLLFLRPIFLYLLPVLAVAWLVMARRNRRVAVAGIAATMIAGGALVGYMYAFAHQHGVVATSAVSTLNRYYILRKAGVIDTAVITHPALRHDIAQSIASHGATLDDNPLQAYESSRWIARHGLAAVDQAVNASERAHAGRSARLLAGRWIAAACEPALKAEPKRLRLATQAISPGMNMLWLMIAVYAALWLTQGVRARRPAWMSMVLLMMGVSNIIVAVVGAQDDWTRLVLPSMPVYLLMTAQLLNHLHPHPTASLE